MSTPSTEYLPPRIRRLPFHDNIHTSIFTPREYQVELLDAARKHNLIMCLGTIPNKIFVSLMLVRELAYEIRQKEKKGMQWTIIVFMSETFVQRYANMIRDHVDLKVAEFIRKEDLTPEALSTNTDVLVMTTEMFHEFLQGDKSHLSRINLTILGDSHLLAKSNHQYHKIANIIRVSQAKLKILGLSANIMQTPCENPHILEMYMNCLERTINCRVETSSNMMSLSRFGNQSNEIVVQCSRAKKQLEEAPIDDEVVNCDNKNEEKLEMTSSDEIINDSVTSLKETKTTLLNENNKIMTSYPEIEKDVTSFPENEKILTSIAENEKVMESIAQNEKIMESVVENEKIMESIAENEKVMESIAENGKIIASIAENEKNRTSINVTSLININKEAVTSVEVENEKNANAEDEKIITSSPTFINENMAPSITLLPDLETEIRQIVESALAFVTDHVYRPEEIYGSLDEDLNIPDPNIIPKFYLNEILYVLTALGPWCSNRAARRFLKELKKHKDDTPYERHYLLISMVYTVMELVQAACDYHFRNLTEVERILKYSSPKILRLLDILVHFKPKNEEVKAPSETSLPPVIQSENSKTDCCTTGCENQKVPPDASNKCNHKVYSRKEFANRNRFHGHVNVDDPNALCGLVFVDRRNTACIMHMLLKELSRHHEDYRFLVPNFLVGYNKTPSNKQQNVESREVMVEHRKQEEVLRRFRLHECNLLVTTSVLQEGIDIPKCNLVVRFDLPKDYKAYVQCKGRARASKSHFVLLVETAETDAFMNDLARFKTIEEVLLSRCHEREIPTDEDNEAASVDDVLPSYQPSCKEGGAKVSMSTAISLVNKYSAKLPSDTFTRLTPCCKMRRIGKNAFQAVLFLPINSPVKKPVIGPIMKNEALAKMAAALKMCEVLHKAGELDDNLFPVGKESVQHEEELMEKWEEENVPEGAPKPGTTKRRQYYYKSTAKAFVNCHPQTDKKNYVYVVSMQLTCPIPEEQNTRGRRIYAPEETHRCFGIVTAKPIPKICGFPVFTRSGEVTVQLEEIDNQMTLNEDQLKRLSFFHYYTFSKVLRLEKYPMKYDPATAESSYFIVPLNKLDSNLSLNVDWEFVDLIYSQENVKPRLIPEDERIDFTFDLPKYEDSVVMPWYRNLDQPQYFYVAEICYTLNPKSDFPDDEFETFENYYYKKYNIQIKRLDQPLLDVDHTSARLNLLTPRYVNRKGVALPTSSEETKRAKRENLQQKQILVPELCTIHPFPASLWRKAVCLPCVLYRANSLLVSEQLRVRVAEEAGLGMTMVHEQFEWPVLDFGWSLADVLRAHAASKEAATDGKDPPEAQIAPQLNKPVKAKPKGMSKGKAWDAPGPGSAFDIGTWSNDMAVEDETGEKRVGAFDGDFFDLKNLPGNLMMLNNEIFNEDEEELEQMNLANAEMKRNSETGKNDGPTIRIGSPSNFEDDGWEFDSGEEVDVMNIPGFSFISVSGGAFNLEDLSRDLEAYEEESTMQTETFEDDEEKGDYPVVSYWGDANEEEERNDGGNNSKTVDKTLMEETEEEVVLEWDNEGKSKEEQNAEESLAKEYFQLKMEEKKKLLNVVSEDEKVILNKTLTRGKTKSELERPEVLKKVAGTETSYRESIRPGSPDLQHLIRHLETGCDVTPSVEPEVVSCDISNIVIDEKSFSFDRQVSLSSHPGPSPSVVLQALTMSNANDGINLERLETIGDSFLKHAITAYLYCTYPYIHEGKLSYLRSKQVSNLNLYRLGKKKGLGECMVATKFEPNDNWLPPGYFVSKQLEQALIDSGIPAGHWNIANLPDLNDWNDLDAEQIRKALVKDEPEDEQPEVTPEVVSKPIGVKTEGDGEEDLMCFIPYNLMTQHSIPDKSIADCVEALIGAYLTSCGPRGALLFMSWLGIKVLPQIERGDDGVPEFGFLYPPPSPLLRIMPDAEKELELLLNGYDGFEKKIGYRFRDRSYLLQAFTHASYHYNRLTDCYQRLEFLGDAVLDYLITRHLYEDPRQHSPGTLTDLRSALVNNTIFATLAVKHDFHKYFKAICPGLFVVIDKFVQMQKENNHKLNEEYYFIEEDECEEAEDIEVPKALGDVFESVAGAIYLDSGMSLDTVWTVYYNMMKSEIEQFMTNVPKSPIRELLEMEPETAKFGIPEKTLDGKVRVTVEIFGKGKFRGLGRNYRIAKCTAAKHALKALKRMQGYNS